MTKLPVLADVDVLVTGSCSGMVAAALAAAAAGRRVMAVSDVSYFGMDAAGTLQLWPAGLDRTDPLVAAMYPDPEQPTRPTTIKHALETALVAANVPFLYLARRVGVLRDEAGGIAGALLAVRGSLAVVRCRALVEMALPRPSTAWWTVLADGCPAGWEDRAVEITPAVRARVEDRDVTFHAWRLPVDVATLGDEPAAWEHALRANLVPGNLLITADLPASTRDDLEVQQPEPGRIVVFGATTRSDVRVARGREAGALAAAVDTVPGPPTRAVTGGDVGGELRVAPILGRGAVETVELADLAFPVLGRCDVAVVGGGTGGAPAGIAAAREGASTVVLETQHGLGGIGTLGLISSYYFGNVCGFTSELDEALMAVDMVARESHARKWHPELKAGIYAKFLAAAGGAAWFGSFACGVRLDGNRVDALLVSTPFGCGLLEVGAVVDATGNADVPAAAGAPCRTIGADHVATQGTGLSPRRHPGIHGQNSDFTFVDETDPVGITATFVLARAKQPDSWDVTPLVDSRERRQIRGEYELSPLDIIAQRTFPDTICTAASNFDTHGFTIHPLFMVAPPGHEELYANVPYRCLLPREIDGVLVTGLGVSAHRDALPVIRMQADVQNQGYAAGLAAALAVRAGIAPRALDVKALQRRLVAIGNLAPDVPAHTDSFPLPSAAVVAAAAGDLTKLGPVAVCLAHADAARPLLVSRLAGGDRQAAALLGMMGVPEAAPVLAEIVAGQDWDDGWDYRGMGQFGMTMSAMDVAVLALARTGEAVAVAPIIAKIGALGEGATFSHCRAVALAAVELGDARLGAALAELLAKPGIQGYARPDLPALLGDANDDLIATAPRNGALRELYLARGLYAAGDVDGLGQRILEQYAKDRRGHFARHAQAILAGAPVGDTIA